MPFNPTLPVNSSTVAATELRAQFNGLKDLIDAQALQIAEQADQIANLSLAIDNIPTVIDAAIAGTPSSANSVVPNTTGVSDPPTTTEVESIRDKVDELINALQR